MSGGGKPVMSSPAGTSEAEVTKTASATVEDSETVKKRLGKAIRRSVTGRGFYGMPIKGRQEGGELRVLGFLRVP